MNHGNTTFICIPDIKNQFLIDNGCILYTVKMNYPSDASFNDYYRLLDSLIVECWLRVREVPGSIPSQGPRHTKDIIKMVPVVPLFKHSTLKREILALSQE